MLDSWIEWLEIDEACAACDGQRLNREALAVRYREPLDRRAHRACRSAKLGAFFGDVSTAGTRSRDRARHRARAAQPPRLPRATSASAISRSTARRRRSRAAKRSASASRRSSARTCAASATSSTSRPSACIRATTASCSTRSSALQAKGNTLIVVEHDEETIRRAAHVIDLGPGAGKRGGEVIAQGTPTTSCAQPASITGRFLAQPLRHPLHPPRAVDARRAAHRDRRREPAQPEERRRARAARPADGGHRRFGLAASRRSRATCCTTTSRGSSPTSAHAQRQAPLDRLPRDRRLGRRRARARSRPDADRQDAALVPGDLRRLLGRDAPALRRNARSAHARLHREPLLVQHGGRALRGVRRPGREAHRDELPARRAACRAKSAAARASTPRRWRCSSRASRSATCSR